MAFNLKDYERVKERKLRLRTEYPTAVIIPTIVSPPERAMEFVIVRAEVWINREAYQNEVPPDSAGLSLSIAGGSGADKTAWMENCEESAIGRALDNLGFYGDKKITKPKCSREEVEKAQRTEKIMEEKETLKGAIVDVSDWKGKEDDATLIDQVIEIADWIGEFSGDPEYAYNTFLSYTQNGEERVTTAPVLIAWKSKPLTQKKRAFLSSRKDKMIKEHPGAEVACQDIGF